MASVSYRAIQETLTETLLDDVLNSDDRRRSDERQCSRRDHIRCVGSGMDGLSSLVRNDLFQVGSLSGVLENSNIARLQEKNRMPLVKSIEYSVTMSRLLIDIPDLWLTFGDYDLVGQVVLVRHRVTHPKKMEDLAVCQEECDLATLAFKKMIVFRVLSLKNILHLARHFGIQSHLDAVIN